MSSVDQTMSLYIPDVEDHLTKIQIMNTFKKLCLGEVSDVDFFRKDNCDEEKRCAHVHFNFWYYNQAVENLQTKLIECKKEVRIVYDDPDFWVIKAFYFQSSIFDFDDFEDVDDDNVEIPNSYTSNHDIMLGMLGELYDDEFLTICEDIHRSQGIHQQHNLLLEGVN